MAESRIETFIGFCIKSGKITLGFGAVDVIRSGVYLLLVCSSASANAFKLACKYKNRFSCPMIICKSGLENAVNRANCKIAAIRDENLARAIIDSVNGDYELYVGGSN